MLAKFANFCKQLLARCWKFPSFPFLISINYCVQIGFAYALISRQNYIATIIWEHYIFKAAESLQKILPTLANSYKSLQLPTLEFKPLLNSGPSSVLSSKFSDYKPVPTGGLLYIAPPPSLLPLPSLTPSPYPLPLPLPPTPLPCHHCWPIPHLSHTVSRSESV